MLILSKDYIEENGGNRRNLALAGQEKDGSVWAISKMNLLLHGIADADMRNNNDGTLEDPAHIQGGELMRFDRVITNPPFSLNYNKDAIPFPERFRYGYTPETGKKADLMFVQHMLAVTRTDGMVATVMPHGVLFRGGDEGKIRTGLLDDDVVEAVIGLGPQLFYGTGIPACILILRHKASKPAERQGKVLFINADRDYREGRAQNYLEPEHIEKIVSAYRAFADIPAFARVVTRQELAENDYSLNIRRYVDTTPAPEPQDVRAHLHGGIPLSEVDAKRDLFAAHGMKPEHLLAPKEEFYLQFADIVTDRRDLRRLIESDDGVAAAEADVTGAIEQWWKSEKARFDNLQSATDLVELRKELIGTFASALQATVLLDYFAVNGVIASWWGLSLPDLKALATLGYRGLIEAWIATALDALEEEKAKINPLDHKVARALLPEYLDKLAAIGAEVAELDSAVKSATASDDEEDDTETSEGSLSPAEIRKLKSKLTATKKQLKAETAAFRQRLGKASEALNDSSARQIVLDALQSDLLVEALDRIARHRRAVIVAFETWWDKYRVTLTDIEVRIETGAERLAASLKELGYE
jgi:type I restriction enzyme M protein